MMITTVALVRRRRKGKAWQVQLSAFRAKGVEPAEIAAACSRQSMVKWSVTPI